MKLLPFLLFLIVLSSAQEIRISAIVQGKVERVNVREGQRVSAGDLLIVIDPSLYTTQRDSLRAQLNAQRVSLEKVERDFRRYEELFNRGLLSRSEYEDWKSKYDRELSLYESLASQLQRVERLVEYCIIHSPVSGTVKKLLVREGMFVNGTTIPEVLLIIEEK